MCSSISAPFFCLLSNQFGPQTKTNDNRKREGSKNIKQNKNHPHLIQEPKMKSATAVRECSICLVDAASRGGIPLISPGCCGQMFHMECIANLVVSGNRSCPNCRTALSPEIMRFVSLRNIPPPAPTFGAPYAGGFGVGPAPAFPPGTFKFGAAPAPPAYVGAPPASPFGRPHRHVWDQPITDAEEPVSAWTPPSAQQVSSMRMVLEGVPELPVASLAQQDEFHMVVSLKSLLDTSRSGGDASSIKSVAEATPALRAPMDILCILDVSGSSEYLHGLLCCTLTAFAPKMRTTETH